ncbi:MAG: ABC transporter permease [Campylobacteraceae bacterium 4484_166]|nr:MAG: ABC transporter permease [Campylobacteraceae bacterium 4484_166]
MYKTAIFVLIVITSMMFLLPYIYTVSPYKLDASNILLSPSWAHICGTDRLGRDIFARILQGGQISLIIGFLSATISTFIGLMVGVSAGYFRFKTDKIIIIVIDIFLTIPTFFLLLAIISYVDASIFVLVVVLSIASWMSTARLIRAGAYEVTHMPYIDILNIAKTNKLKILLKYYTPILAPIFLISWTFGVGGAILAESSLSFLGLGINPPQMSWGSLISDGRAILDIAWWVSFYPGLFIFLVTFCLFVISNRLQR